MKTPLLYGVSPQGLPVKQDGLIRASTVTMAPVEARSAQGHSVNLMSLY